MELSRSGRSPGGDGCVLKGVVMTAEELLQRYAAGERNFSGMTFERGIELEDAKIPGINLSNAILFRAKLSRAYLRGANLSNANLGSAWLEEANLRGQLERCYYL
jgi:uncharacterized protein YjbI with pentapeptide repeats